MNEAKAFPDAESLMSVLQGMQRHSAQICAVILRPRPDRLAGIFIVGVGLPMITRVNKFLLDAGHKTGRRKVAFEATTATPLGQILEMMESSGKSIISMLIPAHGNPIGAWMLCGDALCRTVAAGLGTLGVSVNTADLEEVAR